MARLSSHEKKRKISTQNVPPMRKGARMSIRSTRNEWVPPMITTAPAVVARLKIRNSTPTGTMSCARSST
jgi:hypothetical protein